MFDDDQVTIKQWMAERVATDKPKLARGAIERWRADPTFPPRVATIGVVAIFSRSALNAWLDARPDLGLGRGGNTSWAHRLSHGVGPSTTTTDTPKPA